MTKYINSKEALPANLHIWDARPTQTAIMETRTMDFYPTSAIDSSDVISFIIPSLQNFMLDKVEVLVDIRVLTAANGNPAQYNNVSTVPYLAAALWRNVDVSVGGVSLTQSFDNSYPLFQFWETLIHSTNGLKPLLEQKEGLLLDNVTNKADSEDLVPWPALDGVNRPAAVNPHSRERAIRIARGQTVSLVSDLNVSLFKQEKLLPQNLEIQIGLTKNYSEFILMSAADVTDKVVFEKVILRCIFQRPSDIVLNLIEERLARQNAIYHADKGVLTFHSISAGAEEFTIDNLFTGTLPYCFLVGVQDRTAFGRDRTKNPFSLHTIHKVQLFVNGAEHFPKPIERTAGEYGIMYDTFLKELGYINRGDTMIHDHYKAYPAMAFDLTQDKTQNQHSLNLMKSGSARITIGLDQAAPANQVLMVLAWYEQVIEITKDRQVLII